jgi:hypothetical protein
MKLRECRRFWASSAGLAEDASYAAPSLEEAEHPASSFLLSADRDAIRTGLIGEIDLENK